MSFLFAFPLGLAALAALVVPLLLHLARRVEEKRVVFPALRWLRTGAKPQRRIRIEEWPLLLVRCALVALLALAIAEPLRVGFVDATAPYVVVVPGAEPPADAEGAPAHWLVPGFPIVDRATSPPAARAAVATASLLRELDTVLAPGRPIVVVAPPIVHGLDAERLTLSRPFELRVVPVREAPTAPERLDAKADPIRVTAVTSPARAGDARYVQAAVAAWNAATPDRHVYAEDASDADWLVAIGTEPTPGFAGRVARYDTLAPSAVPDVLEADFPDRLRRALEGPRPAPAVGPAAALRPDTVTREYEPPRTSLVRALLLAALILFAIERVLATRKGRFGASADPVPEPTR